MMTAAQIRKQFLDFFASKQHIILPSAPIVVKNDPTLLFTNAGMNQFKDYFLGNKKAPASRVTDTQKCLRVSGKHNDLEEVGVDTYHHTMFEMLGNWSFGDYFKKEAIAWSWELLTDVYNLPKDRLYVTVFGGDEKDGLPADDEARLEWAKYISPDRILNGSKKDNFWEMGDTGPCGPCSEIHVDCRSDEERKETDGKLLVNNDHPQVIEIWNNVFMEFNRLKDGKLESLPAKHVDTGMGLERLVRVLQNKQSNYDTDLFSGTIREIENITGIKYTGGADKTSVAFRVLADHLRAICFTIADGQLPSNTGAGYVIRRILRRAVRYYYSYLDRKHPLLCELIPVLAKQFSEVFPELHQQESFVLKVVKEEEEAFLRTMDKGIKRIADIISESKTSGVIPGKEAFELYDTYGFPIDLTRLIASEENLHVDEDGFEQEMQQQKNRSRAATVVDTGDWIQLREGSGSFVGYEHLTYTTHLLKYRSVKAKGKQSYQLVLAETPFYPESGGQTGDTGVLIFENQSIHVLDTKKENDLIVHFVDQLPSIAEINVEAKVDTNRRSQITVHHSATHLLHAALRQVLGEHVAQKGSMVSDQLLRFDFSHFAKMTPEEMNRVESIVNEKIRLNHPVVIRTMPKEEALALGAMALFGEKYGEQVRVVVMDPAYSVELCGGTHVGYTGELGCFRLVAESAVAAGVRRLEALTGEAAESYIQQQMMQFDAVRTCMKNPKDLIVSVQQMQNEVVEWRKKYEQLEAKMLEGEANVLLNQQELIGDISFIGTMVEINSADALKKLCYDLIGKLKNGVVVLCANISGKASVAIAVSESLVKEKNIDASAIIKTQIAPLIKGGGGGQKTLATAGGQQADSLPEVVEHIKKLLHS
jgi:alanyl-tRNA synthetase